MKRYAFYIALFLTLIISVCSAEELIKVQCPDDFELINADVSDEGNFLLSGRTGSVGNYDIPMLLSCDTGGKLLWSLSDDSFDDSSHYRDAEYFDKDTIITLKAPPYYYDGCFIEFIVDGKPVGQTDLIPDSIMLTVLEDGFLVANIGDAYYSGVEKMNMNGDVVWRTVFDEGLTFNGLITQNGLHAAFGYKIIRTGDTESPKTSFVIVLDDKGNVLWRHDGASGESFTDAVWTPQGDIVVIADIGTKGNFIAKYSDKEQLWRTPINYVSEDGRVFNGFCKSMLSLEDGYLAAYQAYRQYEIIRLLHFDTNGNIINAWDEYVGQMYTRYEVMLRRAGESVYLITHGIPMPETPEQEAEYEEFLPCERITVIKRIAGYE